MRNAEWEAGKIYTNSATSERKLDAQPVFEISQEELNWGRHRLRGLAS